MTGSISGRSSISPCRLGVRDGGIRDHGTVQPTEQLGFTIQVAQRRYHATGFHNLLRRFDDNPLSLCGGGAALVYRTELSQLNIQLIISMIGNIRPPDGFAQPPFQLLWLRTYDNFFSPIPVRVMQLGVRTALEVIQNGGNVLVHCRQGVHRSVAMAAAILNREGAYGVGSHSTVTKAAGSR